MKKMLIILMVATIAISAEFNVSDIAGLSSALATSQSNGEDNTIYLSPGIYALSATLEYYSGSANTLTIEGEGAILDGGGTTRIMSITSTFPSGDLTLTALTFRNGFTEDNSGGLYIETESAEINVSGCSFIDCRAEGMAGGMNAVTNTGLISVSSCDFTGCVGVYNAGGLNAGGRDISVTGCTFTADSVFELIDTETHEGGDAGGCLLYTEGGSIVMSGNTFTDCYSPDDGGGGFCYLLGEGVSVTANNNICTDNFAALDGAGLFLRINGDGDMEIRGNVLTGNQTTIASGAGIFAYKNSGSLRCTGNHIENNSAQGDGGGAWLWSGDGLFEVDSNTAIGNTSSGNGGGFSILADAGTPQFHHNIMAENTATGVGGGLNIAVGSNDIEILHNTSYMNTAGEGNFCYLYFDGSSLARDFANNISYMESPSSISWSGLGSFTATYSMIDGASGEPWFGTGCIDDNPLFVDAPSHNFNLSWASFPTEDGSMSPAIDAGSPTYPTDPDSTPPDMGALFFDQITGSISDNPDYPANISLTAHPNPFNSALHITAAADATVTIHDTQGRMIADLGTARIWEAKVESGVYIIVARSGDKIAHQKCVLMK